MKEFLIKLFDFQISDIIPSLIAAVIIWGITRVIKSTKKQIKETKEYQRKFEELKTRLLTKAEEAERIKEKQFVASQVTLKCMARLSTGLVAVCVCIFLLFITVFYLQTGMIKNDPLFFVLGTMLMGMSFWMLYMTGSVFNEVIKISDGVFKVFDIRKDED